MKHFETACRSESDIPADHLISPLEGKVVSNTRGGFSPGGRLGQFRVGRVQPMMPVAQLYVDSPALNFEMGWCRDS